MLVSAMECEIEEFKKNIKVKEQGNFMFPYYIGNLLNKEVILYRSGIGKVMASMTTQHIIDKFKDKIEKVIFTGIAGGLNKDYGINDLVIAKDTVQHDFDARPFRKLGVQPDTKLDFLEGDKELLNIALSFNPREIESDEFSNVRVFSGRVGTGDQFVSDKDKHINTKELNCDCVEMEGAAVAFVCKNNNLPCLIIRTISDKADGSSPKDFYEFEKKASKLNFECIRHIFRSLDDIRK